eukprot:scaffold2.g7033.t1
MATTDPYAMNDDGTAKDPVAFREALKADPAKLEALEKEPEVYKIVLGEDVNAFQELIKSVYQARGLGSLDEWERLRRSAGGSRAAGCSRRPAASSAAGLTRPRAPTRPVQSEKKRQERLAKGMAERTIDAQRLYAQLRESGLQYGPAFRLLRNVHTPDVSA